MLDLFVVYSRQSEDEVRGVLEDLAAIGDTVWSAPEQHGGTAWWDQTLARIRACDVLLFALTPRTLESEACSRQLRYAQALDKPVLAVELGERANLAAVPMLLSSARFVNYRRRDREAALRLCRVLRPLGKARPLPAVLPAPPELPPADFAGLRDRIVAPGKLDAHQQMALIAELTRDVRDLHVTVECRQLLMALRRRRDLSPNAAYEIDTLLRKTAATRVNVRRHPALLPPTAPRALPESQRAPARPQASLQSRPKLARHLVTMGWLLAVVGVLLVVLATWWLLQAKLHQTAFGSVRAGDVRLGDLRFSDIDLGPLALTSGELGTLLGIGAGVVGLLSLVMFRRSPGTATRTSSATR